jgi:hypothetical protein
MPVTYFEAIKKLTEDKRIYLLSIASSFFLFWGVLLTQQAKFQVSYPLGWDQPYYVYQANTIIQSGVLVWMRSVGFWDPYYPLLAIAGSLTGNSGIALTLLEEVQLISLIVLTSILAFEITRSYAVASLSAIFFPFFVNSVRIFILPRQSLGLIFMVALLLLVLNPRFPRKGSNGPLLAALSAILFVFDPATYVLFLLTILIMFLIVKNRQTVKWVFLGSVVAPLVIILIDILAYGGAKGAFAWFTGASSVTYWPQLPVTVSFVTSEWWQLFGASVPVLLLCIVGTVQIARMSRVANSPAVVIASWTAAAIVLFLVSLLLSAKVVDWYTLADRSLLLIPVQLLMPVGLLNVLKLIGRVV